MLKIEIGDAEAMRSRVGNVEGKSERRENKLYREIEELYKLLAIASSEELVLNACKLLQFLHQILYSSSRHGGTWQRQWLQKAHHQTKSLLNIQNFLFVAQS